MTMRKDFCAFILTHGRPDRVLTYKALRSHGYTGPIRLIVDNEDGAIDQYREAYGKDVVIFDKAAMAPSVDTGDNFPERRGVVYARNACFDIAKWLGFRYFIQLDDDYDRFNYKRNPAGDYVEKRLTNLDEVLGLMLDYFISVPSLLSIAMGQNGDYPGGKLCVTDPVGVWIGPKRKCMNSFICSTERPFRFVGRINEDCNTYVDAGSRGGLFMTVGCVALCQRRTQAHEGGMTELYLDNGTYVKSFYSVLYQPSAARIALLPQSFDSQRIHHLIRWRNAVPLILSETHRKASLRQAVKPARKKSKHDAITKTQTDRAARD